MIFRQFCCERVWITKAWRESQLLFYVNSSYPRVAYLDDWWFHELESNISLQDSRSPNRHTKPLSCLILTPVRFQVVCFAFRFLFPLALRETTIDAVKLSPSEHSTLDTHQWSYLKCHYHCCNHLHLSTSAFELNKRNLWSKHMKLKLFRKQIIAYNYTFIVIHSHSQQGYYM